MINSSLTDACLTIFLGQRIDTATAPEVEAGIDRLLDPLGAEVKQVVIDCRDLEFISSTGLRILLKLQKRMGNLEVTNVTPEVYNVFDMTGFTRIMTVRRTLRHVSIAGCPEIGRGGVGVIYRLTPDSIIKVFVPESDITLIDRERTMAKESFVLGMPTAIPFDTVWVEETGSYGLIFELINAKTLSATIKADPEHIATYGRTLGRMMRDMHAIHVPAGTLPVARELYAKDLCHLARHFSPEQVEILRHLQEAIPEGNSLLHNDCHPKNVMMSGAAGHEEPILIDMGEVSRGHPLIDLSHTYSSLHIAEPDFEPIIGFSRSLAEPCWRALLAGYFDTDDAALLDHYDAVIGAAAVTRSCLWIGISDYPAEVIAGVRRYADETLVPGRERLYALAEEFSKLPL